MLKRSATTILVIVFIGMLGHSLGCGSSAPHYTMKPFKNRAKWNFATEQEYGIYKKAMEERAADLIEPNQRFLIEDARTNHWSAEQAQAALDAVEQARTGDPQARSCRRVFDPLVKYDYGHCSKEQLVAELFQGYLEAHQQ